MPARTMPLAAAAAAGERRAGERRAGERRAAYWRRSTRIIRQAPAASRHESASKSP
jgi:hypothetical protein